jgi:translocation and assembly module TamB
MTLRKLRRISLIFLISVTGVLILLFAALNLRFSQRFATRKVNQILGISNVPIQIREIRRILPNSVLVQGVLIEGLEKDTLVYAEKVQADIRLLALTRNKVVLEQLLLQGARVHLRMDQESQQYNIAEVFAAGSPPSGKHNDQADKAWSISIHHGNLSDLHFQMSDPVSGLHILQDIHEVGLKDFAFLPAEQEIRANTLDLGSATGYIKLEDRESTSKGEPGEPWNFVLLNLALNNLDFTLDQNQGEQVMHLILGEGDVKARKMDILSKVLDFKSISVKDTHATLLSSLEAGDSASSSQSAQGEFPWLLQAHDIDLAHMDITLGNTAEQGKDRGGAGFHMSGIELKLKDFLLDQDRAGLRLNRLSFELDNGFALKNMEGEVDSDKESTLLNLAIETDLSKLAFEARANQSIVSSLSQPREIQNAALKLQRTSISLKDFYPFLQDGPANPVISALADRPLTVSGDLEMNQSALSLSEVSVSQDHHFLLSLEGEVTDPFAFSKATGELDLALSGVDQSWMKDLLLKMGIAREIPVQNGLTLEGRVSKSISSSEFDLRLRSDLGNLEGKAKVESGTESFSAQALFGNVLLGEILDQEDLGAFSGSAEISGRGFAAEDLQSSLALQVDSLWFRDYKYTEARIEGRIHAGEYNFHLLANDPFFTGDLRASLIPDDSAFLLRVSGDVAAQLNELHLTGDTLSASAMLEGRLTRGQDYLRSEINATDIKLVSDFESSEIEEVTTTFVADSLQTMLQATGDFFQLDLQVAKRFSELDSLGLDFKAYLATFKDSVQAHASTRVKSLPGINAHGSMTHHDALAILFKDSGIHVTHLDFSLQHPASENRIKYGIQGDGISFKMVVLDSLQALFVDSAGILNTQMELENMSLFSGPQNDWLFSGSFTPSMGSTFLSVKDPLDQLVYDLGIAAVFDGHKLILEVPSQSIIMNRVPWQLESPDLLSLDLSTQTLSPSLSMYTGASTLRIIDLNEEGAFSYQLEMKQVEMESLVREDLFPGRPDASISGSLAWQMREHTERRIETDLHLSQVNYSDLAFEDILLRGHMIYGDSANYFLDLYARLDSAQLHLTGLGNEEGEIQIQSEFSLIPLNVFEPFTRETLSDLKGYISGEFNASNLSGSDRVDGRLSFQGVQLRIDPLNSAFLLPDQGLLLQDEKLLFQKFRILDAERNELLVDGFLDFENVHQVYANLNISSSRLQVMSRSGEEKNIPFYGDVFVDSDFSVKGPLDVPSIRGTIRLSRGTEVFYRHMEDLSISESQKILNFESNTDQEGPVASPVISPQGSLIQSSLETILEIDPSTRIHVNLSKKIYDLELQVKGGGRLNYNMLNNSQMSLSGRYDIGEGSAELKLVGWPDKSFRISEGGYIRWDGKVEDPELNFKALNRVSSSYQNPIDGKQRPVEFDVGLQLTKQLSDLDVLFTVSTDDQYLMSIINTLSPEEQMRQAISILLFEAIDLPGISSTSNYMSQQMNQIVASQLNQLTQGVIKGVDISFGLDTYTTIQGSGEQTNTSLSYEVRKSLLNDRATIEVSGRLRDINQPVGTTNAPMNNVSLEYSLDSAATKFLKVYNEHTYEDVFEGEVIKTGIGFFIRKRHRHLSDIWKREEKRKGKRQKRGEQ